MNVNFESRINEAAKLFNLLFANVPAKKFSYLWIKQGNTKKTIPFDVSVPANRLEMAKQAIIYNDKGYDVYFGVCLMDKAPTANNRAKTNDITSQVAIWTDIDIESSAHKSSEKEKLAPNFDTARGFLPFEASILVSSGYGLHGYNLLDTPLVIDDSNRNTAKERNRKYLDVIRKSAGEYKIDGVADLARVLRVPGTYNYKLGRDNPSLCHIVNVNDVKYSLEAFDNLQTSSKKDSGLMIMSYSTVGKDYSNERTENIVITAPDKNTKYDDDPEYDKARVLEMLKFINPSVGYDDWILVGITLKAFGYSVNTWDEWSRPSEKYEPGKCEEKWQTFKKPDTISPAAMHALAKVGKYDEYSFKREYYKTHQSPSLKSDSASKEVYNYEKPMLADEEGERLKAELEIAQKNAPAGLTNALKKFLHSYLTDLDCADLFCAVYKDYRFNSSTQAWYKYDGVKWSELDDERPLRPLWYSIIKVVTLKAHLYAQTLQFENDNHIKMHHSKKIKKAWKVFNALIPMQNLRKTNQIIDTVSGMLDVYINDTKFDADKHIFNTPNATINLKNLQVKNHNPLDYCTMSASASLDNDFFKILDDDRKGIFYTLEEGAKNIEKTKRCKEWDAFIESAIPDYKTRKLLQKYMGYCMSGLTSLKVFFFIHGVADTGKSLFIRTMKRVFGDYAKAFPIEYVTANRKELNGEEPTPILFNMRHCRLAISSETKENRKLDTAKIKMLTGEDPVTARTLHKPPIEFLPQFKFLFVGNFAPKVDNIYDSGVRTRLRIIPFNQVPKKKNTKLDDIFAQPENQSAILNWVLQGAFEVMKDIENGINPFDIDNLSEEMKQALTKFYDSSDNIPTFLEDEDYQLMADQTVYVKTIWQDYLAWCKTNDERHLRRSDFETNLLTRYPEIEMTKRDDHHKGKVFVGIYRVSAA